MSTTSGDGVELSEAAERLELSVAALRKRLQRGGIPGTKRDGRWYVEAAYVSKHGQDMSYPTVATAAQDYRELYERAQNEVEWLRRENERKDAILMGMTKRLDTIEGEVKQLPKAAEAEHVPRRRRWWTLFLGT